MQWPKYTWAVFSNGKSFAAVFKIILILLFQLPLWKFFHSFYVCPYNTLSKHWTTWSINIPLLPFRANHSPKLPPYFSFKKEKKEDSECCRKQFYVSTCWFSNSVEKLPWDLWLLTENFKHHYYNYAQIFLCLLIVIFLQHLTTVPLFS